ncbi:MAG: hypothetical protein ABMA64_04570 [Myxococcota bacterium]
MIARALRWAVTLAVLAYSGWTLARAWGSLTLDWRAIAPAPIAAAALTGAAALGVLAVVSAAGARAAGLGTPGRGFVVAWLRVWFQGYFYRYVPGKVALVVERARLAEPLGVPRSASVMLVVWETLLLLAGAGAVGGALLVSLGSDGPVSGGAALGLAAAAIAGSLALGPGLGALADRYPAIAARVPGAVLRASPLAQVGLVLGNAIAWTLLGGSFAWVAAAMPGAAAPSTQELVAWFVASYVGGQLASAAPAGLGVREGLLVAGLAGVAPAPVVLGWALAHRTVLSAVELVLVGLVVVTIPISSPGRSPG